MVQRLYWYKKPVRLSREILQRALLGSFVIKFHEKTEHMRPSDFLAIFPKETEQYIFILNEMRFILNCKCRVFQLYGQGSSYSQSQVCAINPPKSRVLVICLAQLPKDKALKATVAEKRLLSKDIKTNPMVNALIFTQKIITIDL